MSKNQPEFELQGQVAAYLRIAYPRIMFLSDVRASTKLTIPQQMRSKKVQADNFAMPDMVIFAVRNGRSGLFLELKAESPWKKDGTLKKSEHLERQDAAIKALIAEGYDACFCWNFPQAKASIDWYLTGRQDATQRANGPAVEIELWTA